MSAFVTLMSLNDGTAKWAAVKVISLIHIKLSHTTFDATSMLSSSQSVY